MTNASENNNPLQSNSATFEKLYDAISDYMFVADANTGELYFVNKAGAEVLGYAKEEMIGREFSFLHPEEDRGKIKSIFYNAEEGKDSAFKLIPLLTKKGDVIPAEVNVSVIKLDGKELKQAVFRNISDSDRKMKSNAKRAMYFESLLKRSPGYFFRSSIGEGGKRVLSELDSELTEKTGQDPKQFIGLDTGALHKDPKAGKEFMNKLMKKGHVHGHEGEFQHNGKTYRGDITAYLIRNDQGEPKEIVGLFVDKTEEYQEQLLNEILIKVASKAHEQGIELEELSRFVFQQIQQLIPIKNFYIAIADRDKNELYFPFHRDVEEVDETVYQKRKFSKGVTEYVINNDEDVLLSKQDINKVIRDKEVEEFGRIPVSYMGVRLIAEGRTFGVIATQSFDPSFEFSGNDLEVLRFISSQIAIIFERERRRKQLLESERQFRKLVEGTADLTFILTKDGEIKYVSHSVGELFKKNERELIGEIFWELIGEKEEKIRAALADEKNFEFSIGKHKAPRLYYSATPQEMLDDEVISGIVINAHDITQRVLAEQTVLSLSKYPGENPDPIMRINQNMRLMFTNPSADALLTKLGVSGTFENTFMSEKIKHALRKEEKVTYEVEVDSKFYLLTIVPIEGEDYINIYGQDITEVKHSKVLFKFEMKERMKYQNALNKVYEIVSSSLGERFFYSLAKGLSDVLSINHLLFGELDASSDEFSMMLFDTQGKINNTIDCSDLTKGDIFHKIKENEIIVYPLEGERRKEHLDNILEKFDSKAVIVIPLLNSDHEVTGMLSCFTSTSDNKEVDFSLEVMKLFSLRASTELERLKNERALKRSEAKNRAMIEAIPDHLFTIDARGVIMDVKQGTGKDILNQPEKIISGNFTTGFNKKSRMASKKAIRKAFETDVPQRFDFDHFINGKEKHFEAIVSCINSDEAIILSRDKTEEKNTEFQVLRQREFLRSIIDSDPNLIYVKDAQGNIKLVNHSLVQLLGKSDASEIENRNVQAFCELVSDKLFCTSDDQVYEQQKSIESEERIEFDDEVHYYHSIKVPLSGSSGKDKPDILGICLDITDTKKSKEKIANAIVETQEHERNRFAKDLHDGLGQVLLAARMNLDSFSGETEKLSETGRVSFFNTLKLLKSAITETRNISHGLMSRALDQYGLVEAMKEICNNIRQSGQIEVEFDHNGIAVDQPYPDVVELGLYRIFQELVNNVIKHAGASHIRIELNNLNNNTLVLMVEDDGEGFDVEEMTDKKAGLGLQNIEARVKFLGGSCMIHSSPGNGTTFCINLPLK